MGDYSKLLPLLKDKIVNKKISYSQFSTHHQCKKKFYLKYVKGNYIGDVNMNLTFGTSMHEAIQEFVRILYSEGKKQALEFDIYNHLYDRFCENYKSSLKSNNGIDFTDEAEISEYYEDGVNILDELIDEYSKYFKPTFKHLGTELHILSKVNEEYNIHFEGYMDDTFYDGENDLVVIYDYKTSKSGWNNTDKTNDVKLSQLRTYKYFVSNALKIPYNMIEVRYVIMKRKVFGGSIKFGKPKHIELFVPTQGGKKINDAHQMINTFIVENFDTNGKHLEKIDSTPSPSKFNCGFCPFKKGLCEDKYEE